MKNTGGNAFPKSRSTLLKHDMPHDRMSLRDYFAAKAMQGILSRTEKFAGGLDKSTDVALSAYNYADQMISEMEK
mgnify:CR=1 FL=1